MCGKPEQMRIVFIAFLSLLCVLCLNAQSVTVIDKGSKEPLEAVTLSTKSGSFAITDNTGSADLSAFSETDSIEVRLIGYETIKTSYNDIRVQQWVIEMATTSINLDQIVISASKWEQSKREIPTRIASITADEIAFQNPQTAADLLGTSGEVFIQKSQLGGGSPMIRGFSTNRILIVVDGIRMNNAIFRGGNLQNVIAIDPYAVEGTEVLFGPGSVIYGSDAIGGVMSFQTLEPWLSFSDKTKVNANAGLRYATVNQEKTAHFDFRLSGKKWGSITSVTYTDYNDQRMGSNGREEYLRPFYVERVNGEDLIIPNDDPEVQTPTGYDQINLMQKFRFVPSKDWDLEYVFHYSRSSDVPRYDRLIQLRDGLPRSAEWAYGPQKWMLHNFNITHQSDSKLFDDFSIRMGYQFFEESRIDRNFGSTSRRTRTENVDVFTANIDFLKKLGETDEIYYGLEAIYNRVTSSGFRRDIESGASEPAAARYPKSDWRSFAAYLTYKNKLSKTLTLQTGARFNHVGLNATFDRTFFPLPFDEANLNNGALTATLGLVYEPNPQWLFRVSAASGFRAPNVDDVGKIFDSEPGSVVVPNPELKPEFAYNGEISLTRNLGKRSSVFLNAYYTFLDNALVRRDFQLNGQDSIFYDGELSQVQAIQNAATANVYGVEFGADLNFQNGFGLMTRINFQRGEEELDNGEVSASRHAAPPFGILKFKYQKSKIKLEANLIANSAVPFTRLSESERGKAWIYATDENGNPFSPGWYTLNLKGSYSLSDQFSLSVGLENLTDQRYRPYSSGIVAAGRNLILSMRGSF